MRDLTGNEFTFTPYARGLEVELQEKLEEVVDGRGMIQARTQRRLKWKNVGALMDDLESGSGTSVLGPVARDVIQARLTEASLGLRPSIRPKPIRKRPSLLIQTVSPAEPSESERLVREAPPSKGLEKLGLTTRQTMILHSLNIRSLQDLMNTNERLLAKHLAKTAIHGLKKRAGALERLAANPGDTELSQADLSRQIVTTLSRMGVRKLSDLAHRSKSELWRQSELSASDVQRILRICRDHGVAVKQD